MKAKHASTSFMRINGDELALCVAFSVKQPTGGKKGQHWLWTVTGSKGLLDRGTAHCERDAQSMAEDRAAERWKAAQSDPESGQTVPLMKWTQAPKGRAGV